MSLPELAPGAAPSLLGEGLDLDASAVDNNLRSIRSVESSWRLPALPDEVRLDLATLPGVQPATVSRFLTGLDRDAHGENPEDLGDPIEPEVPALQVVNRLSPFSENEASSFTEASATIATLRGLPATDVLDPNAVQRLKMRAIEDGFLDAPENGQIDGSWSPELSTVQREMQRQQLDDFYRGDRPGAVPFSKALEVLNDWTSPTGLMRMAVNLDLMIDPGAVAGEFQSWGDKWRKVGDSKNPLDFGKNLLDAMTGPIDDIVVPIINVALLFSGVGSTYNFARLGATGVRGVEAVESFNAATKLYRVPKALAWTERVFPALNSAEAAGEAYKGLSEASWLAQRLKKGSAAAESVGDAMSAWRAWDPVVKTKRVLQAGMRLGFVSQVEDRLLPGYQGGLSLGDTGVGTAADKALDSTPGTWARNVGEVLLTPYTFFEPGTFTRGGKDLLGSTFKLLGTAPGRAAAGAVAGAGIGTLTGDDTGDLLQGAAIGAVAGAGAAPFGRVVRNLSTKAAEVAPVLAPVSALTRKAGEALAATSWAKIADDQKATATFYEAMRRHLPEEEFNQFSEKVRANGFKYALGEHYGIESDDRSVGGLMSFVFTSASIDRTAALQAGERSSKGWKQRYWLARNKLTSQLRMFDPATVTPEELAWAAVSKDMATRRGLATKHGELVAKYKQLAAGDPNALAELVSQHNQQAALTMRQLLSPENLPIDGLDGTSVRNLQPLLDDAPEARWSGVADYIATSLDSFGNWSKYAPTTTELGKQIESGALLDARLRAPINLKGQALSQLEMLDEWAPPVLTDPAHTTWSQQLGDTLFLDGKSAEEWRQKGGYMTPFARELDPSRSRFTLARAETPAKHEMIEAADELKQTLSTLEAWKRVSRLQGKRTAQVLQDATKAGQIITEEMQSAGRIDVGQLGQLSRRQMTEFTTALGLSGKSNDAKALRQLNWFAQHHGLTIDDAFDQTVRQIVDDMGNDPRWAERFGMDLFPSEAVTDADGTVQSGRRLSGEALLERRRKELTERAKYTAAEVDVDDLIAQSRAAGKDTTELEQFFDHVSGQGYKVVYGSEFLSPDDLLQRTGVFADINERHLNAMTLGNFFGRKQPEALRMATERSQRLSLAAHLSQATGEKVDRDSEMVTQAMKDLYRYVLDPAQAAGAKMVDDLQHQAWLSRRLSGVRTYDVPLSLQDLGLGRNRSRVMDTLVGIGWDEKQAAAIWQGLKEGRHSDWHDLGLSAIEAKLRNNNQMLDSLKVLGGTSNSSALKRAAVGAAVGAGTAAVTGHDVKTGALVGAGAGAATSGKALGRVTERVTDAIDYTKWARYGYLADNLANLRDRLRFTLSPWFDVSRYCLAPETKVLTGDYQYVEVGSLKVGDSIMGFDEEPAEYTKRNQGVRKWRNATVTGTGRAMLPSYRVTLEDGTSVVCSEQHKWLMTRGTNKYWATAKQLFEGQSSPGGRCPETGRILPDPTTFRAMKVLDVWQEDNSRTGGYLAGMLDGEGCVSSPGIRISLSQRENSALRNTETALADLGFGFSSKLRSCGKYDDVAQIYIKGGLPEAVRLLGQVRPQRLLDNFEKQGGLGGKRFDVKDRVLITSVEYLGEREVVTLGTSTHTLIAEGFAHHNTEAHFLNLTSAPKRLESGERVALPLVQTPRGLRRQWARQFRAQGFGAQEATNAANDRFARVLGEFRAAAKGEFDPDSLESTGKWFQQVGIMGYNPTAYMATSFHHLREAGFEPKAAWEAVKDMHSYGTTGRSAAELSANFIFFPFSFQKKAITHAAGWLADDMVRSVLIHDAFKAYEVLNERYDLNKELEDHVPVLEKLQQLNLFAFGLSPGVLGGINAPFVNAAVGNPLSSDPADRGLILNLFMPQAVDASNADKAAGLQKLMRRTIPAIYDLQHLLEDTKEQGHVLFDPTHQTTAAQARDGYAEWNDVKRGIGAALKEKGYSWGQLSRREELAPLNDYYVAKRLELEKKYPGWKASRERSLERIFERNQALKNRIETARLFPAEASQTDIQLAQFDQVYSALDERLKADGINEVEDWSPDILDELRGMAIGLARANPRFNLVYDEFYSRQLGPISSLVGR